MTFIIGAVGPQVAVLATDSLRSGDDGSRRHVSKMRTLSERVVVAKGGYGNLADGIWNQLSGLSGAVRADPYTVADAIQKLGHFVYVSCKKAAERQSKADLGLYFLIAGIDGNDQAVLISIDIAKNQCKSFNSDKGICLLTMGDMTNSDDLSFHERREYDGDVDAVEWVQNILQSVVQADNVTVGFPAYIYTIDASGMNLHAISLPKM